MRSPSARWPRCVKAQPAAFMHPKNARQLITAGNIEDHLGRLADCDWIIEAIVERARRQAARSTRRLDAVRKPGSIVSSNTSTIPLRQLIDGLPPTFAHNFLVTHFFNPPRYMRLLEVVAGATDASRGRRRPHATSPTPAGQERRALQGHAGLHRQPHRQLLAQMAMPEAIAGGLEVEEADAALGPPVGIPKTGVFGLLDLVGIDLVAARRPQLLANLPPDDSYRRSATCRRWSRG